LDNTHLSFLAGAVDYAGERARIADLLVFTSVHAFGECREGIVDSDSRDRAGAGEEGEQDLFSRHVWDRSRFCVEECRQFPMSVTFQGMADEIESRSSSGN
jgi:hypothetical protein